MSGAMDLTRRSAVVTAGFALLVESIARDPHLNGEVVRLDAALRHPPKEART